MNRETGIRLVYLFVGYGRKIGKFPYSWCRLSQSDKPVKTPPNRISKILLIDYAKIQFSYADYSRENLISSVLNFWVSSRNKLWPLFSKATTCESEIPAFIWPARSKEHILSFLPCIINVEIFIFARSPLRSVSRNAIKHWAVAYEEALKQIPFNQLPIPSFNDLSVAENILAKSDKSFGRSL